jgi:spore coat protein H
MDLVNCRYLGQAVRVRGLLLLYFMSAPLCAADESDRFFSDTGPIPIFQITVDKDNLEKLHAEPRKYVHCTVRVGDHEYKNVGIHLKGAAGSFRPIEDKPALTLEFNKFDPKQYFNGLDRIHLNNSVQDPRYMTEILGGRMMLAAGVPTARATHGLVELNGRKLGLSVVKEGYHTVFLQRHFGSSGGNLYDGGFLQDIDGELKRSHGHADVPERADLKAAAAAARTPDIAERFAKMEQTVDMDKFLKMMAIEVLTWHWDGYAMKKNNYRVYHDPKTSKLVLIPHGMDQLWDAPNGPIQPPFEGLIARKLILTTDGKDRYRKTVSEMLEKHYKSADLCQQIDDMLARFKKHLAPTDKGLYDDIENHARGLQQVIKAREASVRLQLKS